MVISLQGVNFTSQQARVKHRLKVSEYIFEMLALMGMLLVSFRSSRDHQSCCRGQSVILALFFDWEIYFTPEQTFLHQNLYTHPYNILKIV